LKENKEWKKPEKLKSKLDSKWMLVLNKNASKEKDELKSGEQNRND